MLGSDSYGGTISGLANVDEQATVAAGSPPDYYSASVDIQTTLASTLLRAEGHASAAAGPASYDPVEAGYAGAELVQGRMLNEGEEICWLYNPDAIGKSEVDGLAAARHSALYGE